MKDFLILIGILIVIGFLAFILFASDYRVHASTPVVAYCFEVREFPFAPRFTMCSEIDRYYDA